MRKRHPQQHEASLELLHSLYTPQRNMKNRPGTCGVPQQDHRVPCLKTSPIPLGHLLNRFGRPLHVERRSLFEVAPSDRQILPLFKTG